MNKKIKIQKKVFAIILLFLTLFSVAQPVFCASGSGTWTGGQYGSGIKTTDNADTKNGVIIRRLNNTSTGERKTVFCAEHGVEFETGVVVGGNYYTPTDATVKTACKIAYFGWYSKYGEYAVDGYILAAEMYEAKLNYVFTQQYIWEVLGQSNATFIDSSIQSQYEGFKSTINSQINAMKTRPSFISSEIELDAGTSKTLTDANGVLADYNSVDRTIDGIRVVHNRGENTLTVTVSEDCQYERYRISDDIMKSWGLVKEETQDNDTTVYFEFSNGIQNQLYAMNYNDPVTMNLEFKINLLGNIELTKLNTNNDLIDGATFRITGNNYNQVVEVKNGKLLVEKIKKGEYSIKEESAPNGYLLNTETYKVQVNPNQTTTQAIVDDEPTGIITILKKDSETGSVAQGDATLTGAVYKVYAAEDIYNKAKTKKIYSNGDLIATRTMSENGTTEDVSGIPLGKYIVKETNPSQGYLIDNNEYQVTLTYKDQNTKVISQIVTSNEEVKKMQVHIFKSGIKENSGVTPGLEGIEFTFKLYEDVQKALEQGYTYVEIWNGVDESGNKAEVDSIRTSKAQTIAPTYDTIKTDADGNAYTIELPYGKYIGKETKSGKDYYTASDFTFSITQDESEIKEIAKKVKNIVINNEQMETYIKLIKKDLKTNKKVTLSSSTFEIKAAEDIYDGATGKIIYKKDETIKQKVGTSIYSSFTTNADNVIIPDNSYNNSNDNKGTITTPLLLPVGNYKINEINVPNGFLQLDNPVLFKLEGIKDYDQDNDGDYIKVVEIKNEQPKGTLNINKTIALRDDIDTSLVDILDLSNIEFKLTAKEDIIDYADGSVIYEKGKEIGKYNLTKEGKLLIENLNMGKYELEEIKTLEGLVLDTNKYEIDFKQSDLTTKIYNIDKIVENKSTVIEFSKTDITGDKELIGATLSVIDENGKVVDNWISTEKTHKIEGLLVGKEYILREEIAPDGFVQSNDIRFIINNTDEIQKVVMIDKVVTISKIDIAGEEIEGATLILTNTKTKNIVDKWISTKEAHIVSGLIEGETYILHEEIVAEGYVKASDIQFTVTTNKQTQKIEMIDKVVEIVKTDIATGEEIEGAELKVVDENGNIIDTWISTKEPHKVAGLEEGKKYTLVEVTAPLGYEITESIDFEVTLDKETQRIEMKDQAIVETPKTGDDSNISLWICLLGISLIGIAGVSYYEYKNKKENKN